MKAYRAYEEGGECATIVFAETVGKAKSIAQNCDACEGADWVNIRVNREPAADRLYKGGVEIDWYDNETRLILVRDLGWRCAEPSWECEGCAAKEFCCWMEE